MKTSFPGVAAALAAGALIVALPATLLRFEPQIPEARQKWTPVYSAAAAALIQELEVECDPDSPTNEYYFSHTAQPTELRRGQILAALVDLGEPALAEVRRRIPRHGTTEIKEMLVLAALMLGDQGATIAAAQNMVESEFPAVRIVTARVLRRLRDPEMAGYFQMALHDTRMVRNDGCGRESGPYYPVRTIAGLALRDMGLEALE